MTTPALKSRRDWVLIALAVLTLKTCADARDAERVAADAIDQSDAAEQTAHSALSRTNELESDLSDLRREIRFPR